MPAQGNNEAADAFAARMKEYRKRVARVLSILGQTIATEHMYLIASREVMTPQ